MSRKLKKVILKKSVVMFSVLGSFECLLNRQLNLSVSIFLFSVFDNNGGSGSKFVYRLVATYENQKDQFRVHMCYENA